MSREDAAMNGAATRLEVDCVRNRRLFMMAEFLDWQNKNGSLGRTRRRADGIMLVNDRDFFEKSARTLRVVNNPA